MKCDVEVVENQLLNLVKAKLPAKLTEIMAEKADSIVLETPTDDQYFNTTDDHVLNQSLLVKYGLIDGDPVSIFSKTAEENRYLFMFCLDEMNAAPGVIRKKLFRYIRALKEIFEENFDAFSHLSSIEINSIAPTSASWDENEMSPVFKVGGVYIETSLVS